ncbi:ProQ/FINO family protein [Paraburkholderia sp. J12]|uniref:ProQ/FINO family protein n=1 Tax=Paraburkholderia sp. J12 TaxID=2805432 RepID=UPI002ABE446E|nr:ProQ/FINO family protein [Paraburkholderia sp. J12]
MKAASQQRRPLSLKEGLLELKRSMGKGTGQTPEEQPQAPESKPARKGPPAQGKDTRARGRPQQSGGGRPQGAKPQQPRQARAQHGGQNPGQNAGQNPGQKPAQPHGQRPAQHRQRPARAQQPAANLTEAEKARIERNRQLNTVWNVFAKHYPAFRDRLPLKIGVAEDLVARHPDYDRTLIVAVLKRHVNHPRYHERVAAGGSRYELDGSASAGPGIEASHIGRANAALARQKAKAEAQAKAKDAGAEPPKAAVPEPEAQQPTSQPAVQAEEPVVEAAVQAEQPPVEAETPVQAAPAGNTEPPATDA